MVVVMVGICALVCLSAVKFGYVSQGRAGDSMVSVSTCLCVRKKKFHLGAIMAASVKAEPKEMTMFVDQR